MKTVLISIQPKWVEKIISGEKTIEVRKTTPKAPFRAFIYETLGIKKDTKVSNKSILGCPIYKRVYQGRGKIIGEFICEKVDKVINHGSSFSIFNESKAYTNRVAEQSVLDFNDLKKYLETKDGYAWHITDLKVYDKPKELSEFRKPCIMAEMPYCPSCKYGIVQYSSDEVECSADLNGACSDWLCCNRVTRPPQSWMYVEEEV